MNRDAEQRQPEQPCGGFMQSMCDMLGSCFRVLVKLELPFVGPSHDPVDVTQAIQHIITCNPCVRDSGGSRDPAHVPIHPGLAQVSIDPEMSWSPGERPAATQRDENPELPNEFGEQALFHPTLMPTSCSANNEQQQDAQKHYKLDHDEDGLRFAFKPSRHRQQRHEHSYRG